MHMEVDTFVNTCRPILKFRPDSLNFFISKIKYNLKKKVALSLMRGIIIYQNRTSGVFSAKNSYKLDKCINYSGLPAMC